MPQGQGLVVKPGGPIPRGGQFHLSCSVSGAVDPAFIWYKDARYLINATAASRFVKPYVRVVDAVTVGVLVVQEAAEWDNGKFFCRVRGSAKGSDLRVVKTVPGAGGHGSFKQQPCPRPDS